MEIGKVALETLVKYKHDLENEIMRLQAELTNTKMLIEQMNLPKSHVEEGSRIYDPMNSWYEKIKYVLHHENRLMTSMEIALTIKNWEGYLDIDRVKNSIWIALSRMNKNELLSYKGPTPSKKKWGIKEWFYKGKPLKPYM